MKKAFYFLLITGLLLCIGCTASQSNVIAERKLSESEAQIAELICQNDSEYIFFDYRVQDVQTVKIIFESYANGKQTAQSKMILSKTEEGTKTIDGMISVVVGDDTAKVADLDGRGSSSNNWALDIPFKNAISVASAMVVDKTPIEKGEEIILFYKAYADKTVTTICSYNDSEGLKNHLEDYQYCFLIKCVFE